MWFDFGGVWSNFLLDQTDETVCYNTVSNEFSCSSGVNNGGCSGGVTVCGNGDECGGIVTLQQQQLQTQQCNMENSVFNNNHNINNYNNNSNYNTAINNDVGCEKNFQNYQRRNFYTNPACHNEFVYEQQQQTQQQFSYQRPHCSYNNSHDNFMNVPQHQRQQQQQHQQQVLYSCEINAQQKLQHAQQQHFQPAAPSHDVQHQHQPQHQYQFNQHSLVERTASNPCQGNPPWTYAYCFGYGPYVNQGPCQLTQVVDIEDFMNNEKRKERSRDAARCRRSRETEIFIDLAQVLPLKKEDVQQLDKASVMRIAISYLKVRDMLKMFPRIQALIDDLQLPDNNNSIIESSESSGSDSALNSSVDPNDSSAHSAQDTDDDCTQQTVVESEKSSALPNADDIGEGLENFSLLLKQTLDGFLLILSNEGDITYVSGNICDYLGLSKIDILGQQIWEYAHQCDHAELKEALNIKRNGMTEKVKDENFLEEGISTHHRDLFVRLKCTITNRGRSVNIKSASYKVIHITGHLVVSKNGDRVLVAMGRPIPHPSNIEVPLGSSTFLTKHSLDMKFTYADEKMFNLLGYKPADLLETSLFNYHHGSDSISLLTTFKNVLSKGQGETCRYRFLGKCGGYCWLVTQATIVYDKLKPQSVVCINFVISDLENKNVIYTLQQYQESQKLKIEDLKENQTKERNIKDHLKEEKENTSNESAKKSLEKTTTNVERTTPPLTPLNNNNKNNQQIINNNKLNEDINNTKPAIKQEQIPPTTAINNNSNSDNNEESNTFKLSTTATVAGKALTDPPLLTTTLESQLLQQLPTASHCPTTTVTHTIFNKVKAVPKFFSDKGPKTVTSSLILNSVPTTTSTQSILQQQQTLNVATRAPQSVTASVFSPLPPLKFPISTGTAAILAKQPQSLEPIQQEQSESGQQASSPNHQQDMNKGFLSFPEDATELTMLKEEPDDLTVHLVVTNAGDACMPLDESVPLFGEMLVSLGMASYDSLMPDEINSLDSNTSSDEQSNNQAALKSSGNAVTCSPSSVSTPKTSSTSYSAATMAATTTHNLRQSSPSMLTTTTCATNNNTTTATPANSTNIDPFINYRDESNDTNCSQHLLSPSLTSKSPEGSSLPSLCSPNSLSQEDEFSYYTMNVEDMDDLTMRAPYIPMNEQDDLPLLTADDYMWNSGNAFTPDEFSLHAKDSDSLHVMQMSQSLNYQPQQFTQHQQQQQQQQQQQFANSLCSSPASTVSSMSPSPIQQQQNSQQIFSGDSSELNALFCGSENGGLSLLQDATNFTNSLNLNGGSTTALVGGGDGVNGTSCNNQNSNGSDDNGVGITEDLDGVGGVVPSNTALDHHQQLQQHCLQQFQEQLQQQQQQLLSGLNINCKKEKFATATATNSPSLTSNLCASIEDTFDNVYAKNSTNLDCWNEFLEIGTNENTNTTNNAQQGMESLRQDDCKQQLRMQLQQQQQTQNIIINAVPLLTIQPATSNNKNVLISTSSNPQQQQQQQHQLQPQLISQNLQSNTKSLNKVNSITLTPITSTATIKIIENKQPTLLQQQAQQNIIKTAFAQAVPNALNTNNKRHSSATQICKNNLESKRLKNNNILELQNSTTTSQLLHQLIATPQQQQQQQQQQHQQQQGNLNSKSSKCALESKWPTNENQKLKQQQQQLQQQQKHQQHQKQSNSVLKNLLISGCDKLNLERAEVIAIDDGSRSSMQSPQLCLSPSLAAPLKSSTSTALLRNYRYNPWIGGPGASVITNDDSLPPGLTACDTIDSGSDSGIDDMSCAENMSPLKRSFAQHKSAIEDVSTVNNRSNSNKNYKDQDDIEAQNLPKVNAITSNGALLDEMELAQNLDEEYGEEIGDFACKRKRSISYLDSSNPLMTPSLMDLCINDYHMSNEEYLHENTIENVLSEWLGDLD